MILEQNMTGTVIAEMMGIPGNDSRVTFDCRDGLVAREQAPAIPPAS